MRRPGSGGTYSGTKRSGVVNFVLALVLNRGYPWAEYSKNPPLNNERAVQRLGLSRVKYDPGLQRCPVRQGNFEGIGSRRLQVVGCITE